VASNSVQIFDAMKKYSLGIEEATRFILVSRAVRREWLRNTIITPAEAIEQLVSKISLDNILYESSSDDDLASDDDEQHRLTALRDELRVDPLHEKSTGTSRTTGPSITRNSRSLDAETRKNARKRQFIHQSPWKATTKQSLRSSSIVAVPTSRGSAKGAPTLAGRKRSVDEIGERQQQQSGSEALAGPPRGRTDSVCSEVDAKIASTQRTVADSDSSTANNDVNRRSKRALRPSEDVDGSNTAHGSDINGIAFGQR
jgi:hypothetical protein